MKRKSVLRGILGAAVIAACANCRGQSNVYSLNVVGHLGIPIHYDFNREWAIGPPTNQFCIRDYKIDSVRTVAFMHSQATATGTFGSGQILLQFRTRPFSVWIWPKLIGSLGALGVAALLPLAAVLARRRTPQPEAAATY
jgi:hypothetical protein